MAENTFTIFKETDKELIDRLFRIENECGCKGKGTVIVRLGEGLRSSITVNSSKIEGNKPLEVLLECDSAISHEVILTLNNVSPHGTFTIIVNRLESHDKVRVNYSNETPIETVTTYLASIHRNLRAYARTESTDKLLGDELAEFYRKREEGLLRLEGLSQKLIKDNQEFRAKIENEFLERRNSLEKELQGKKEELETEHLQKLEQVEKEKESVDQKLKELDDRNNTHARRKLREDLKQILSERSKEFSLTRNTIQKRIPIHLSFIFAILGLGFFASYSLFHNLDLPANGTDGFSWISYVINVKSFVGLVGVVFMLIYYIRWNDKWSETHAEEEFRLKRLDLDIDRASWVVEMALEWQKEKDSAIPSELIERLTNNLFEDKPYKTDVTHPNEDLLATLLGASSSLKVDIPAIGQMELDRKSIKNFRDKVK